MHNESITALRLNDGATILQAELAAILEALQQAKLKQYNTAVVVTDSKAAIATIDSTTPMDNKALIKSRSIHRSAAELSETPEITWVPAHVGVQGNETADAAAKSALSHATVEMKIPTSKKQIRAYIKKTAIDINDAQVRHAPSRSVQWNQQLQISEEHLRQMWKLPRHTQKDISKLRTFARTRMQIVEGHDTCSYCDYPFEDYTTHYLSECPANRTERIKLLTDDMHNITDSHKKARAILTAKPERDTSN